MTYLILDTETFPIRPGRQAPRTVCVQLRLTLDGRGAGNDQVLLREPGLDFLEACLRRPDVVVVGHSVSYDALSTCATRPSLIPLWVEAYHSDRVLCTAMRERLILLSRGQDLPYSLVASCDRWKVPHSFPAGKESDVRVRYGDLDGIPVADWPDDARRYAFADLIAGDLFAAQAVAEGALADQFRRARHDLYLRLISAGGMRTVPRALQALAEKTEIEAEDLRSFLTGTRPPSDTELERLDKVGVPWEPLVRPNGKRKQKEAGSRMRTVCLATEIPIPVTKTGQAKVDDEVLTLDQAREQYPATDKDACKVTGDPVLIGYARYGSLNTTRARIRKLAMAHPYPVQPGYDALKETGRTSAFGGKIDPGDPILAFGDSVQNYPREPGLRECYVARPGYVLISVDIGAAELHSLAQVCKDLGLRSTLGEILMSGKDVHSLLGGRIAGKDYDWVIAARKGAYGSEAAKEAKGVRQGGKAVAFGCPGGLGAQKLRLYAAKTYDVIMSLDESKRSKREWHEMFPEMYAYFDHVKQLIADGKPLVQVRSGRVRKDFKFTSGANSYFQGLTADHALDALGRCGRDVLLGIGPLAGGRLWGFAHDEILMEVREEVGHEAAMRVVQHLEDAGRVWLPDFPPKAEPAMQRHWRKGAEPVFRNGRLIPWEDRPLRDEDVAKVVHLVRSGVKPIHASWVSGITESRVLALCA